MAHSANALVVGAILGGNLHLSLGGKSVLDDATIFSSELAASSDDGSGARCVSGVDISGHSVLVVKLSFELDLVVSEGSDGDLRATFALPNAVDGSSGHGVGWSGARGDNGRRSAVDSSSVLHSQSGGGHVQLVAAACSGLSVQHATNAALLSSSEFAANRKDVVTGAAHKDGLIDLNKK